MRKKKNDYVVSSGNVFQDLGFSPDEAEELQVKSGLIRQIADSIEDQGLKQAEAAALIGTDQPTLSKVLRGRLSSVSVERLTSWLNTLGYDVKVTVSAKAKKAKRGRFSFDLHAS